MLKIIPPPLVSQPEAFHPPNRLEEFVIEAISSDPSFSIYASIYWPNDGLTVAKSRGQV